MITNTLIKEHEKNKKDIVDINSQLADFMNFLHNGGKIGSLDLKQSQPTYDAIITSKKMLGFYNSTTGIMLGENLIYPNSANAKNIVIGAVGNEFKDLFLDGRGSIKARTEWYIVEVNGTTAASGNTSVPYPTGTNSANCIMVGGHVIKANGVGNSISTGGYYYQSKDMTFVGVEASRPYRILLALKL